MQRGGAGLTSHREFITLEPIATERLTISMVAPLSKGRSQGRGADVNQRSRNPEGGGEQVGT